MSVEHAHQKGLIAAEQSAERAERVSAGWKAAARGAVLAYCAGRDHAWLLEDARTWAEKCGLQPPPDKRAWGAVIQALKREKKIRPAGFRKAESSNGSPKCLWIRNGGDYEGGGSEDGKLPFDQ
jgi:hypothetical protein